MATCRLLYHEGAKIILQDPVHLEGSEEQALALLLFIQAEDLSRCPFVRILSIVMDPVPESVAKLLADLVPFMTGLERLGLAGEHLFKSYPHLLPTFASLHSVKTLVVAGAGEHSCELIRTLRSELVSANIQFDLMDAPTLSLSTASHPVMLLQRSSATLEMLSCSFLCNTNPELTFFPPKVAYPSLHTLTLRDNLFPDPIPFVRAALNLTHLSIECRTLSAGSSMDMSAMQREMNLELQLEAGSEELGVGSEPVGWAHLQDFTGRAVDLWMLGLACHIPKLFLDDAPAVRPPLVLTEALEHARPVLLQLSFRGQSLTSVIASDFLGALRSQGASGLKRLVVSLELTADDRELDVGPALNDIASAMSGPDLCHLQLGVVDAGLSGTSASASAATGHGNEARASLDLNVAERTLDGIDVHEYAKRLIGSMPSVDDAIVRIDRPHRCGGSQRVAILGVGRGALLCTGGKIVYHEVTAAECERAEAMIGEE